MDHRIKGGCFRLDLGKITAVDYLQMEIPDNFSLLPLEQEEGFFVEVSNDLKEWESITAMAELKITIPVNRKMRYLRIQVAPSRIAEVKGVANGNELDRKQWRASNLFAHSSEMQAENAWGGSFKAKEISEGAYLCVAVNGDHGLEGAYAAIKVDGELVGAPDRAVSYASNVWENSLKHVESNYTYYIPLKKEYEGKTIEVVTMGYNEKMDDLKIDVWQTNKNKPAVVKTLVLE